MEHSQEEIVNALKVIKDTCSTHNCSNCPFSYAGRNYAEDVPSFEKNGDCLIEARAPIDWTINAPRDVWHALLF